jgi:hypothetical protein
MLICNKNAVASQQAADSGAMPALVRMLSSSAAGVQEQAAGAIRSIFNNNAMAKQQAADSGAMPALVRLLSSSSAGVQERAAGAIRTICINNAMARQQAADSKSEIDLRPSSMLVMPCLPWPTF